MGGGGEECLKTYTSLGTRDSIVLESLEYFIELYLVLSILSKCFRCSNESNQKAIRDRSSKVETPGTHAVNLLEDRVS